MERRGNLLRSMVELGGILKLCCGINWVKRYWRKRQHKTNPYREEQTKSHRLECMLSHIQIDDLFDDMYQHIDHVDKK